MNKSIVPATAALLDEITAWLEVEDAAHEAASQAQQLDWSVDIETRLLLHNTGNAAL